MKRSIFHQCTSHRHFHYHQIHVGNNLVIYLNCSKYIEMVTLCLILTLIFSTPPQWSKYRLRSWSLSSSSNLETHPMTGPKMRDTCVYLHCVTDYYSNTTVLGYLSINIKALGTSRSPKWITLSPTQPRTCC